jgi:hypothetical protein
MMNQASYVFCYFLFFLHLGWQRLHICRNRIYRVVIPFRLMGRIFTTLIKYLQIYEIPLSVYGLFERLGNDHVNDNGINALDCLQLI